ncbi:hypothetical protein SAMN05444156_1764 [Verrucomicrobium sp. GAS474]|uniref:hypothetical protein n=1 Tax=Verrucomicrobium sp. GAS474 TaxID=1882831 RepID=UPI00087BAD46|nr:hypothetical protein [Verrucomicrobium sp. GAS474]SDU06647.1 hypothetical protein SAMN05444156_1764 [Verrucomicrobium sp. GAS474]
MAGILTAPAPASAAAPSSKGERKRGSFTGVLCLPGEGEGQYRLVPASSLSGKGGESAAWAEADLADLPSSARIGLPARHLLVVPLWLQTTEREVLRELAQAQLERRALVRGDGTSAWELLPLVEEDGRTLVTAYLVDPELPPALLLPHVADFDAAVRFHALPPEAFVFWREEGGIALAYGKGSEGEAALVQFFPGAAQLDAVAAEVALLARSLAWEGIAAERPAVHLWGSFTPADAAVAEALFGAPPAVTADGFRRSLRIPARSLSLVPAPVRDERRAAREKSRRGRLLKVAAVVYLLAVAGLGGWFGWMKWEERRLAAQVAQDAPTVAALSRTADLWKALAPAVDPSSYPMEPLLSVVKVLPAEMRLTKFEASPVTGKLLLVGEGKDAASAFAFLREVRKDDFLKRWTWTMPQPKVLPNNHAQFQLEGTRVGVAQ